MNQNIEITAGNISYVDEITRFQVDMAMESEGLALNEERAYRGVKAVLEDESKGRYIIARSDEKLVGCLMLTREWSDWNCCWYWWIQSVYVKPSHRGQGIYRRMYNKVLDLAKAEGVTQIRLYVDKNNSPAQEVYQKVGMSECHYCMYEVEL